MIRLSAYARGLDIDARRRYEDKLKFHKGTRSLPDAYTIAKAEWKNDPYAWPELDFGQLFVYLIDTPGVFSASAMRNYKSLEAYRYVESRHVNEVLIHDVTDRPFCFLTAGVVPSMRTRDELHKPWVCLVRDTADVYCAHCTCMAGLGESCSHVAALLKIELGVRFGLTKKCVTSEACKWNQVFKKEVNPCTVLEIQHLLNTNRKKEIRCVIPSGKDALPPTDGLKSLYLVCPNAAFFTSIPPVHQKQTTDNPTRTPVSLPPVLTTLYSEDYKTLSEEDLKSACVTPYNSTKCSQEQSDILFARTKGQNVFRGHYGLSTEEEE